jgi:ABC-2 type transport system ATP-binding protein
MIEVENLVKRYRVAVHHPGFLGAVRNLFDPRYREVDAVAGITFTIERGEFVGFIGPNGAGKSTTIKVLTGVLEPTAGRVRVDGRVPRRERLAHVARLGVVFGQRTQLWWDLPVCESFALLRRIYAVPDHAYRQQLARLVELLAIGPLLDVPVRKLSLGQRMRCELAGALIHAPDVLFLDEPTIGLDVIAKDSIRSFLAAESRERGTTILLTTHDLPDIETLCRRILLIDRGSVVFDGPMADLRSRLGDGRRLSIELAGPLPEVLPPGVSALHRGESRHLLRFSRRSIGAAELIAWLGKRAPIVDLTLQDEPIEELIAHIYRTGYVAPPAAAASSSDA